jgi:hypothetical protein
MNASVLIAIYTLFDVDDALSFFGREAKGSSMNCGLALGGEAGQSLSGHRPFFQDGQVVGYRRGRQNGAGSTNAEIEASPRTIDYVRHLH